MAITVYFDGACTKNPGGHIACGIFIRDGLEVLQRHGFYAGQDETTTSNVAEYTALIHALQFLKQNGYADREIKIKGDSQLVIKQMSGRWKIKAGAYVEVAKQAERLVEEFSNIRFVWISRDENTICDELAENVLLRFSENAL